MPPRGDGDEGAPSLATIDQEAFAAVYEAAAAMYDREQPALLTLGGRLVTDEASEALAMIEARLTMIELRLNNAGL